MAGCVVGLVGWETWAKGVGPGNVFLDAKTRSHPPTMPLKTEAKQTTRMTRGGEEDGGGGVGRENRTT